MCVYKFVNLLLVSKGKHGDTLSPLLKYWRKLDKNRKSTDPILRRFHFRKQVRPHVSVRKGIIYHHLTHTPWKIYADAVLCFLFLSLSLCIPLRYSSSSSFDPLYSPETFRQLRSFFATPSCNVYTHTQTQGIFNAPTFFSIPPNFPFYWMSLMFYIRWKEQASSFLPLPFSPPPSLCSFREPSSSAPTTHYAILI